MRHIFAPAVLSNFQSAWGSPRGLLGCALHAPTRVVDHAFIATHAQQHFNRVCVLSVSRPNCIHAKTAESRLGPQHGVLRVIANGNTREEPPRDANAPGVSPVRPPIDLRPCAVPIRAGDARTAVRVTRHSSVTLRGHGRAARRMSLHETQHVRRHKEHPVQMLRVANMCQCVQSIARLPLLLTPVLCAKNHREGWPQTCLTRGNRRQDP